MSAYGKFVGGFKQRIRYLTFPWTYLRFLLGRIFIQAMVILLIVESIFIADKLNEIILTVVDQHAPLIDIPLFILFRMPDVFGLALPIAVLIACYRVALQARENREFQVFAGVGVSAERLVRIAWLVGGIALMVSATVSGVIAPAAHYAQRLLLFEARNSALREAGSPGFFFNFGDYTIFVPTNRSGDSVQPLFIHQRVPGTDDSYRLIIADGGHLVGLHQSVPAAVQLRNPTIFNFSTDVSGGQERSGQAIFCPDCSQMPRSIVTRTFQAQSILQGVNLGELNNFPPRGSYLNEKSLIGLLWKSDSPGDDRVRSLELGRRLGRALLSLLAPLLAGVGLVFTGRANQALVISATVGLLFGIDLVLSSLVEATSSMGLLSVTAVTMVPVAVAAIALSVLARRSHVDLTIPAMARV